jgi:hypothetical protein
MHIIELFSHPDTLYFSTPFGALQSLFAVLKKPLVFTANAPVVIAQAARQSGQEMHFSDVDYDGLGICSDTDALQIGLDYGGVLPKGDFDVVCYLHGAGFLTDTLNAAYVIIDLKTLLPDAPASGALLICPDTTQRDAIARYATLNVVQGSVWNDKVQEDGIDALMSPLVQAYWQSHLSEAIQATQHRQTYVAHLKALLSDMKMVDLLATSYPAFVPLRLAPELHCPKEDIYMALHEAGIAATVPFKPLYRYDRFKGEQLRGVEAFYRSALALPLPRSSEQAKQLAEAFKEIIERYAYRGCTF